MRSNNRAIEKSPTSPTQNISEYRIGHTLYIVELHFCTERRENLEDVLKRLIARNVGHTGKVA